ncbi:MAG: hypothetical protein KAI43_10550 [Candidatus Aureabacteria bacterium]|nr:hypothetical protein [Candidatus Auribacterota bacterium]
MFIIYLGVVLGFQHYVLTNEKMIVRETRDLVKKLRSNSDSHLINAWRLTNSNVLNENSFPILKSLNPIFISQIPEAEGKIYILLWMFGPPGGNKKGKSIVVGVNNKISIKKFK